MTFSEKEIWETVNYCDKWHSRLKEHMENAVFMEGKAGKEVYICKYDPESINIYKIHSIFSHKILNRLWMQKSVSEC